MVREQKSNTTQDAALKASFAFVGSDNLIRKRIGDTLTDHLRVTLLRMMGYRVDVVDFIDTSHSPKNLLIRAARSFPVVQGSRSDDDHHSRLVDQARREYA